MYESPIQLFTTDLASEIDGEVLRITQSYGIDVNKEEIVKALQYDRNQYDKGYADAKADLDILISEFCVPMEIDNVCEELGGWDVDEDGETWCSRNCGKTNSGKCPEANCYKAWIRMKKAGGK